MLRDISSTLTTCPSQVVGVVITCKPGTTRLSLEELQQAVANTLHPSKWPQLVVYMDHGLPLTATNKVEATCRPIYI